MRPPVIVRMPGDVIGIAAADPTGPLLVSSYNGPRSAVLHAVDLSGKITWQHGFDGHARPPRIGANGTVWIAHSGPTGYVLSELTAGGSLLRSVVPEQEPDEALAAFVLLPDGFCTAWRPRSPRQTTPARLARSTESGDTVWSTPLPRDWRKERARPHDRISTTVPLISGDRAMIRVYDQGGIGICAFLDTATGLIISTTSPAPTGYCAVAGPGRFLVGSQGYRPSASTLHDRGGQPIQTWPTCGMMVVDQHESIRGPEYSNANVWQAQVPFRVLNPDGSLRDGPRLHGYFCTYPALAADGTAVFWHHGQLVAVDSDLQIRTMYDFDPRKRDGHLRLSRTLLLDQGLIVFALGNELLIFRDSGLGPMGSGPWPCDDGNIQGNPATYLT